jgi:hypothetical protein
MKKEDYLQQEDVAAFIQWMGGKLDNGVEPKDGSSFPYKTIYDAYKDYTWGKKKIKFEENQEKLGKYSQCLIDAVDVGNEDDAKKACCNILNWGGVAPKNKEIIEKKKNLIDYLRLAQKLLNPKTCDTDNIFFDCFRINSGFTKIYSLLIPDFIIYDSRVGAALCYLVHLYLEEPESQQSGRQDIPEALRFSYGIAKGGGRNRVPNTSTYEFAAFSSIKGGERLRHNMQAGWLLKAVLENNTSAFNNLDEATRVRALEAALFMIGYALPI